MLTSFYFKVFTHFLISMHDADVVFYFIITTQRNNPDHILKL